MRTLYHRNVTLRIVGYTEVVRFTGDSERGLVVLHAAFCRRIWRCSGPPQLPIPLGMELRLTPGEHVLRGDVTDNTVQADVVVILDVAPHVYSLPGISVQCAEATFRRNRAILTILPTSPSIVWFAVGLIYEGH